MNYDIIGDIHGHADALTGLLRKLGYEERLGAWRHPSRTAAFVGDFIDRGPKQLETVRIARSMVDAGTAIAVMGNHELNAIAWSMPDPTSPGEFLREHHSAKYGYKNRKQHARFLAEVESRPQEYLEIIDWFLSLPLWLELPELNLVHACWHTKGIEHLKPVLLNGNRLDRDLMFDAAREPADEAEKDTPAPTIFKAVEWLTKGVEIPLPHGQTFTDKDGFVRDRVRVRWWDAGATSYRSAAFFPDGKGPALGDELIPAHAALGYALEKPVFFGHYWMMRPRPERLSPRAMCVDYSIAKTGGVLCAYRHDGEPEIDESKIVFVGQNGT